MPRLVSPYQPLHAPTEVQLQWLSQDVKTTRGEKMWGAKLTTKTTKTKKPDPDHQKGEDFFFWLGGRWRKKTRLEVNLEKSYEQKHVEAKATGEERV